MVILKYFSISAFNREHQERVLEKLKLVNSDVLSLQMEKCYYVESSRNILLQSKEDRVLRWLFKETQQEDNLETETLFVLDNPSEAFIEIGPRFNFCTPFSTNCVNICQNIGLKSIQRVESSIRYLINLRKNVTDTELEVLEDQLCDKMTKCCYTNVNVPVESFNESIPTRRFKWFNIPLLEKGRRALEEANSEHGLALGDWDIDYYTHLFKVILKRNPTIVELFDCAQSNSEHSRHWFFRGKMIVDGKERPKSLIKMIMDTQLNTNPNNTIKFSDNSSAVKGFSIKTTSCSRHDGPGPVDIKNVNYDLVFTAETHNMPTAVSPFSGATTGTGGRLRDVQAVGRGGIPIAGTAGYCVGNLNIPGYMLPYESAHNMYPSSFATPLKILIDASDGASDYGNKFGEPLLCGFVLSYGLSCAGTRTEYVKPIMFSGGLGIMNSEMRSKVEPKKGMLLAKIGGPVYRIGVGGGAASSVEVQGTNNTDLDFNAVQRGDPEMENKLNRVIRACIEMEENNPILAIHDQGAGGNGNVLKELVEPGLAGATIFSKEFELGDPTITALELWGAEYQESNAILCQFKDKQILQNICDRERCPISFVGVVTENGYVTLVEEKLDMEKYMNRSDRSAWGPLPFDMHLKDVLGEMPIREYYLDQISPQLQKLDFGSFDYSSSLELVLGILSVGSKRFLTNKVDRCVTGLVAQQQCVGPLHTPLADFALVTVSHFGFEGIATSIGTQPIKGLLNSKSMARMCVAEALSNLVFVQITELADIKCSGNWMWAAKLKGEGSLMYDACQEMCEIMKELNIAVDGGKDSLSMAAKVGEDTIKSPGTLVISTYAPCPDVRIKITPDLKAPSRNQKGALLWVNIEGKFRLGGSALAQAFSQRGRNCPNLEKSNVLKNAFVVTQKLLQSGMLLSGHDISDGGLIVGLLEMAFSGLSGLEIDLTAIMEQLNNESIDVEELPNGMNELAILYAEECGWILEVESNSLDIVAARFSDSGVPVYNLGISSDYGLNSAIKISSRGKVLLSNNVRNLFKQWEKTSFELEKLQTNYECVMEEFNSLNYRVGPRYNCCVDLSNEVILARTGNVVRVAVLREEGVNSDREMFACLLKSNFEVHDICMSDLLDGKTNLDQYRGLVFPGGFSYADTLGSAKGWAANILFSSILSIQFNKFRMRKETFSLGICNGCQLMSLIGWIGEMEDCKESNEVGVINVPDIALLQNKSGRFECRWATVRIENSNSIMLKDLQASILGVWVAHGEGRFSFRHENVLKKLKQHKCIALRYVDDNLNATEIYPMNPNGSIEGIAGICSADGRHLALMPHPERCSEMIQWPYISPGFNAKTSPWQVMFNTAYKWSTSNI